MGQKQSKREQTKEKEEENTKVLTEEEEEKMKATEDETRRKAIQRRTHLITDERDSVHVSLDVSKLSSKSSFREYVGFYVTGSISGILVGDVVFEPKPGLEGLANFFYGLPLWEKPSVKVKFINLDYFMSIDIDVKTFLDEMFILYKRYENYFKEVHELQQKKDKKLQEKKEEMKSLIDSTFQYVSEEGQLDEINDSFRAEEGETVFQQEEGQVEPSAPAVEG